MKGINESNDVVSAFAVLIKAVLPCDFYSTFISLSTAVSEENLAVAGGSAELFGKVRLNFCVIIIRGMLNCPDLSADSVSPFFVTKAERVCAYSAAEIYVGFSVFVCASSAAAIFHYKRKSAIGIHNMLIKFFDSVQFKLSLHPQYIVPQNLLLYNYNVYCILKSITGVFKTVNFFEMC